MNEPNNTAAIARVLHAYRIPYKHIAAPQKGYRNTSYRILTLHGLQLNLIIYKHEPGILQRIRHANAVGAFVAAAGLPARALYDPRILQLHTREHTRYAAIYNYLPGSTIPWEAYTMDHIKNLGKTMSIMHAALRAYPAHTLPRIADESLALNRRMQRYFARKDVMRALRQKLGLTTGAQTDCAALLRLTQNLPNQQALHMDFVRGNMLFDATKITGVIDFEKAAVGHILYDIARTLAFLLVDCKYKPEAKVRKYFLQSGYVKRGQHPLRDITIHGTSLLEQLVNFFLLHDFYKFLRHNPYEYLPQNEHFVRTKTMLLKRGIIRQARVE